MAAQTLSRRRHRRGKLQLKDQQIPNNLKLPCSMKKCQCNHILPSSKMLCYATRVKHMPSHLVNDTSCAPDNRLLVDLKTRPCDNQGKTVPGNTELAIHAKQKRGVPVMAALTQDMLGECERHIYKVKCPKLRHILSQLLPAVTPLHRKASHGC